VVNNFSADAACRGVGGFGEEVEEYFFIINQDTLIY
jgi:hypothetical protein